MLVQKIVTPGITFAVTVLLARGLTEENYGTYGVFQGMLPYFSLFATLGFVYAFSRFIPEYCSHGEMGLVKRLVSTGLLLALASGVLFVGLAFGLYRWLGAAFHVAGHRDSFMIFGIAMVLLFEATLLSQALNALFLHPYYAAAQIAYIAIKAALLSATLALGWLTLKTAVWLEVVSAGLMLLILGISYGRKFSSKAVLTPRPPGERRRVTKYAAMSVVNEIGNVVFSRSTDVLVISQFLGAVAVGPYYLAGQLTKYVDKLNVVALFQSVVTPMFFTQYTEDRTRTKEMFQLLVKLSLFTAVPVVCVYPSLGRPMIRLVVGARYDSTFTLVGIFIALTPLNALAYPSGLMLQALERLDQIFYSRFFALYNLGLSVLLVRYYGVVGVAISTASAMAFKNIYASFFACRLGNVRMPWGGICRVVANSLVAGGAALVIVWVFDGLISIVIGVLVSVAVFLAMSRLNRAFDERERELINRLLGRSLWRF